ncbi:MAG: hypothetical protein SFV17_00140 [Candidatus Obscuribacter sp.]|nr:hypothetical protein [Candidatus Obscuribacter sp.]
MSYRHVLSGSVTKTGILATLSPAGYDFSMPVGRLRLLVGCFLPDRRDLTDCA